MNWTIWRRRQPEIRGGYVRALLAVLALALVFGSAVACQSEDTEPGATEETGGGTEEGGDVEEPTDGGGGDETAVREGGVLRMGTQPANNLDPHFSTSIADILLNHQVYDWLVELDRDNRPAPGIATEWDVSDDGRTWTFTVREGITFHDGSDLTTDDVAYSFDRLRDPDVGAPTVSLYSNIESIEATDETHVEFTLAEPNPEFPADLGDFHAAVLSSDVEDPATEQVGSGPFELETYLAENRATLTKNESYWREGEDGETLPYLDGLEFIFSPDLGAQVEALRGGELDFVGGLATEHVDAVESDPALDLLTVDSNMHFVIHMRSDQGSPAEDERVRQALKSGTDNQGIIDVVRPGLAHPGNGTPVGPSYGDYYLDEPYLYDPEAARELLAEAGYEDGLGITLYAQNALDVPAIATVWKEQMAQIGVDVEIQTVPPDVYYGEGDASWLEVDFGITEWGPRATPVTYFKFAYTSDGQWNESHWSDEEFDDITRKIDTELDEARRVELYHEAQEILRERGPVIVPYMVTAVAGVDSTVEGVSLANDWARTIFRSAHFTE